MARRKAADTAPPQADTEPVPLYDPAVHTDPTTVVFLEFYCQCGFLMRQKDPVLYVEPTARQLLAIHDGAGHGPASKADCVAAREATRELSFRSRGLAAQYTPKDHPNLDTTCTTLRPWPVFHDQAGADVSAADES